MNTNTLLAIHNPTFATSKSYTYTIVIPEKKKFTYRLGKASRKFTSFFKKSETKVSALIAYWAVETVLFAVIMLSAANIFSFFAALFLYVYGTYAIFSAVNALTK